MSFLAIHDVTRALRVLLHSQLVQQSAAAVVTLLPPGDTLPELSGVNLYLYRVVESPFTRNQPWPGDRVTPPSNKPALGLQLYYLLTPLGTKPDDGSFTLGDDAHTMLGVAMLTLQENPVLNDVHLPTFDADTVLPDYLRNSYEQIKVYLAPISLEELSKIWATINKPYRLSVAYEVSLVQLTPTPPPAVDGGIVLTTNVDVITLSPPRLIGLQPATGALVRIVAGAVTPNDLQIGGFGFSFPGQTPLVRVGGQLATIKGAPPPTDTSLTVTLPIDVDGGPQIDVTITLNDRTSTPLTFTVSPWLATISPIRTALDVAPAKLSLQGSGFTANPLQIQLDGPTPNPTTAALDPGGSDLQATATIPAGLPNGLYSVRLVLGDVAHSASNSRTLEVIPRVDSPVGVAGTVINGRTVHQLTVNGARLDDPSDVRLVIDGITYVVGPNATANQLVYTLGRQLDPGPHQLAVVVNGSRSHDVGFAV
jgi:hypothetical protein